MVDTGRSKRIAKNSLLLYIRTLFVLLINLYTSRVILHTLGVVDYGVYNVVGGVIVMLGYLTNSLSGASSRYITYDLGTGDMNLMRKTFGNILSIHFCMAGVVIIVAETLGLWFVLTQLNIPVERQTAAFWVYQCAILSSVVSLIGVPYNAAIVAHERMSAFAYISIIDAILKLLIAFLILFVSFDRLIVYSILFLCIQIFDRIVYGLYCTRYFEETKVKMTYDRNLFHEIFSFAGWTMIGNVAAMGSTQGLNMLLNIFFGPVVNAARGIAVQVQSACQQFCSNFQMALNPQLTKSYAQGDLEYMHKLLIRSSKFSFFILFIIVLPLILEADFVLKLWLGVVPEYTVTFVRLMLIISLMSTLSNPIIVSVHATGIIKKFQLIEGIMLLTIVPISYVLLKFFHLSPSIVFIVNLIVEICTQYARIRIVLPMIRMDLLMYVCHVVRPLVVTVISASILPFFVFSTSISNLSSVLSFFMVCLICFISAIGTIYMLGMTSMEKAYIKSKLFKIIKSGINN